MTQLPGSAPKKGTRVCEESEDVGGRGSSSSDGKRLRRVQKFFGLGTRNDLEGARARGGPTSRWLRPPGADTRSAEDLNNSVLFNSLRRQSKRKTLNLFRGKAMEPSVQRRLCYPPPWLNAPRTFEKRPRLSTGGGRGIVRGFPLLWDHSPKVSSTQQRPSTHKALMARGRSLKFLLIVGAASAPPPLGSEDQTSSRAIRPLVPKHVGPLFTPLLEGGVRETRTHQSYRTTHPL